MAGNQHSYRQVNGYPQTTDWNVKVTPRVIKSLLSRIWPKN